VWVNSDLAPKLKLRLLKIEKLRSRSAPLQNRLIEIGARSQLIVAAPSAFARLIAAVGTLEETQPPDMTLFECISAEIGDEILGPPGTYPTHDEKAADLIKAAGGVSQQVLAVIAS